MPRAVFCTAASKTWNPHGKFPFKVAESVVLRWSSHAPPSLLHLKCHRGEINNNGGILVEELPKCLCLNAPNRSCTGSEAMVGLTVTDCRALGRRFCLLPCSACSGAAFTFLLACILESCHHFSNLGLHFIQFCIISVANILTHAGKHLRTGSENAPTLNLHVISRRSREKIPAQIIISSFRFQNETPCNKNTCQKNRKWCHRAHYKITKTQKTKWLNMDAAQLARRHHERIQTCHVTPSDAVIKDCLMINVSKIGKSKAIWLKLSPRSSWFFTSSCGILRCCQTKWNFNILPTCYHGLCLGLSNNVSLHMVEGLAVFFFLLTLRPVRFS